MVMLLRRTRAELYAQNEVNPFGKTGRLPTVAWLTRNLLELAVWTSHCAKSEANSKQFVLDAARDAHDAMDVPLTDIFSNDLRRRSRDVGNGASGCAFEHAQEDGFETLGEKYTAVSMIARELGKGPEFQSFNKLLSKFAHPTALSVINSRSAVNDVLKEKFYQMGTNLGSNTLCPWLNQKITQMICFRRGHFIQWQKKCLIPVAARH